MHATCPANLALLDLDTLVKVANLHWRESGPRSCCVVVCYTGAWKTLIIYAERNIDILTTKNDLEDIVTY
jgi:hypothetical protein